MACCLLCVGKQAMSCCIINTVKADTLGVLWRAYTGNVDPWSKQQQINQEAQNLIAAGANPCCAVALATQDVTQTLKSHVGPCGRQGSCPCCPGTCWLNKISDLLSNFETVIIIVTVAAVAIWLLLNWRK